jgi:hypothetical protein
MWVRLWTRVGGLEFVSDKEIMDVRRRHLSAFSKNQQCKPDTVTVFGWKSTHFSTFFECGSILQWSEGSRLCCWAEAISFMFLMERVSLKGAVLVELFSEITACECRLWRWYDRLWIQIWASTTASISHDYVPIPRHQQWIYSAWDYWMKAFMRYLDRCAQQLRMGISHAADERSNSKSLGKSPWNLADGRIRRE